MYENISSLEESCIAVEEKQLKRRLEEKREFEEKNVHESILYIYLP